MADCSHSRCSICPYYAEHFTKGEGYNTDGTKVKDSFSEGPNYCSIYDAHNFRPLTSKCVAVDFGETLLDIPDKKIQDLPVVSLSYTAGANREEVQGIIDDLFIEFFGKEDK